MIRFGKVHTPTQVMALRLRCLVMIVALIIIVNVNVNVVDASLPWAFERVVVYVLPRVWK